eukprot:jgi/Hompol1/5131/HPOL_004204-RA
MPATWAKHVPHISTNFVFGGLLAPSIAPIESSKKSASSTSSAPIPAAAAAAATPATAPTAAPRGYPLISAASMGNRRPMQILDDCILPADQLEARLRSMGFASALDTKLDLEPDSKLPSPPAAAQPKTQKVVEQGIADGTIYQGVLRVNKLNRNDAYVTVSGIGSDLSTEIFIPSSILANRALDSDVVAIKKLEGAELEKETLKQKVKKETKMADNQKRQQNCEIFETTSVAATHVETRIYGKVTDTRPPFMMIPRELAPKEFLDNPSDFANILVTVTIRDWTEADNYPTAEYTGRLGQMGELAVETKALLANAGIVWDDFEPKVLDCLPATPWRIPKDEIKRRWDLRHTRIFSIDPETAKDLDDAVSCRPLNDGTYEIGVHIADVSYFVKPGTALD